MRNPHHPHVSRNSDRSSSRPSATSVDSSTVDEVLLDLPPVLESRCPIAG
jgi:hypothetical protein